MSRHARSWMLKVGAAGLAGASLLLGGTAAVAQAATPVATAEAEKLCEGLGATPVSRDAAKAAGHYPEFIDSFAESEYFQCGDGGIVRVRTVDGVAYGYPDFYYPRSEEPSREDLERGLEITRPEPLPESEFSPPAFSQPEFS